MVQPLCNLGLRTTDACRTKFVFADGSCPAAIEQLTIDSDRRDSCNAVLQGLISAFIRRASGIEIVDHDIARRARCLFNELHDRFAERTTRREDLDLSLFIRHFSHLLSYSLEFEFRRRGKGLRKSRSS